VCTFEDDIVALLSDICEGKGGGGGGGGGKGKGAQRWNAKKKTLCAIRESAVWERWVQV